MNEKNIWTVSTYGSVSIPKFAKDAYEKVLPYIEQFLCSSHPYRKGVVCPFVPAALRKDSIYFTFFGPKIAKKLLKKEVKNYIKQCCNYYLMATAEQKNFGAMIIVFPEDFSIYKLLEIHLLTKKLCVDKSLMLGALWDKNQAKSLHNANYFPLRTPTPILVIRNLTLSDLIFLNPQHYNLKMRLSFLNSYINKFQNSTALRLENSQLQQALKLRKKYRYKLRLSIFGWIIALIIIALLILRIGNH